MGNKLSSIKTPKEDHKKDEAQIILFDCQLCNSPISPSMKFTNNDNCPHIICKDCISKHIHSKLEINAIEITCPGPSPDCKTVLDPVSCRGIVNKKPYEQWLDRLCYAAIAGKKKSYCPDKNCQALVIDECGDDRSYVTRAACPACKMRFCFLCRTAWHSGRQCNVTSRDLIDLNDMLFIEMTLGKKKKLSKCPKCRMYTELVPALGFCIVKCRCKTVYCFHCGRERTMLSCDCKEFEEEINKYNGATVCKLMSLTSAFAIALFIWATRISDNFSDTYF